MTDKAKDFARAFLDSSLMDDANDYLQRGRRFESVATPEMGTRWAAAFRAFVEASAAHQLVGEGARDKLAARARDFDDANAEMRLRGIDPPIDDVDRELRTLQKLVMATAPEWTSKLGRKLDDFLADREKPKN
jgi:hypothetical protein